MRHHDRRAKFRCSTCLMVGRTEAGVRLHINMKHKAKGGEVMPINGPAIAEFIDPARRRDWPDQTDLLSSTATAAWSGR